MSTGKSFRFDRSALGKVERTPQGFARVPATLTRVGVLTYQRADGKVVRELRHPDEVFRPDSLESLAYAPVTDGHPTDGLVSAGNISRVGVGHVMGVRRDGDHVAGTIQLQTDAILRKVDRGAARELSAGYTCRVDETPGVWNGEPYDAVQRDIQYNHVALVDVGRAGPSVGLRLDAFVAAIPDCAVEHRADEKGPDRMNMDSVRRMLDLGMSTQEAIEAARNLAGQRPTFDAQGARDTVPSFLDDVRERDHDAHRIDARSVRDLANERLENAWRKGFERTDGGAARPTSRTESPQRLDAQSIRERSNERLENAWKRGFRKAGLELG